MYYTRIKRPKGPLTMLSSTFKMQIVNALKQNISNNKKDSNFRILLQDKYIFHCCTSAVCSLRPASGADECKLGVVISAEIARAHFSLRQLQLFTLMQVRNVHPNIMQEEEARAQELYFSSPRAELTASLNLLHLSS